MFLRLCVCAGSFADLQVMKNVQQEIEFFAGKKEAREIDKLTGAREQERASAEILCAKRKLDHCIQLHCVCTQFHENQPLWAQDPDAL